MEELVKEAKRGNSEAFSELIKMHKKELYLVARSKLAYEDDIVDCIQETILKCFKNLKRLRNNSLFKYWMLKILVNECNRLYKKKGKQEVSIEANDMEEYIGSNQDLDGSIAFESIIKDLDEDERTILTLYYVSGYNTKEIGKILKKNNNTVRVKMMRAKQKLKEIYRGGGIYE